MVVCVCNAIRERDVRDAARAGCADPIRAYASMGRRPRCGQCLPFARELIASERASCAG
jgi:bacterioferritin-associated ferredoxin